MTRHITLEQALRIARRAVGGPIEVRDVGLLDAAVNRPRATVFGQDAYPELLDKAAALLHSLARNHPLVDGNKRLAWLATYVFCAKNGGELEPNDDDAYALIVSVAAGEIDDVETIARTLTGFARHWLEHPPTSSTRAQLAAVTRPSDPRQVPTCIR